MYVAAQTTIIWILGLSVLTSLEHDMPTVLLGLFHAECKGAKNLVDWWYTPFYFRHLKIPNLPIPNLPLLTKNQVKVFIAKYFPLWLEHREAQFNFKKW